MTARRSPTTSAGDRRRSDFGGYEYTERDDLGLRLVAEMKFLPFDLLGQFLAPDLEPALHMNRKKPSAKMQHGGKRHHLGWPREYQKRLHATTELVRRWEKKMGYAETWKPWATGPTWVRITAAGLANLGLPWREIPFPQKRERLNTPNSHTYQVIKRRLALARGSAQAPTHIWISERQIYADQCKQGTEHVERAHRPDGVLLLQAGGTFPIPRAGEVVEEIAIFPNQRIAVEVELSRKKFERLGAGILPSLLRTYDFTWYFCGCDEVYQTVIRARRDYLHTNEERKRIRILLLEEQIADQDDEEEEDE
jgi:hypothetical protein